MTLNTVTLKWDVTDLLEAGVRATLTITPTAQLSDSTDHLLIPPVARTVTFGGGTGQLAGIIANDNSSLLPVGSGYLISVTTQAGVVIVPQFQTQLLFSNGATQWLDALAPVPSVATSYQYLPLPSGAATVGYVPVATGSGEASAWTAVGGSGTVTSVSVATANGFAGTVANPSTTPAVTVSTSVTGLLKGNGTAVSAATAGTDYLTPSGSAAALTSFPTLNQNTSGTAAGLSSTLAVGSGGTGQATQQAAMDALAGAVTSNQVLAGNGSHVTLRALAAADLPAGTTGAKGALQLDGTAGDIAGTGPQAAGATGKAADAGHVHFSTGMFLCAPHVYNPGTPASPGVTSATLAAFDTTNITTNSFSAPASGNVLVTASFLSAPPSTQIYAYALAAHGTVTPVMGNVITMEVSSSNVQLNAPLMFVVTGLTPGNSYQFDLLGAAASGTITIKAAGSTSTTPTGSVGAPVVMMVQAI